MARPRLEVDPQRVVGPEDGVRASQYRNVKIELDAQPPEHRRGSGHFVYGVCLERIVYDLLSVRAATRSLEGLGALHIMALLYHEEVRAHQQLQRFTLWC